MAKHGRNRPIFPARSAKSAERASRLYRLLQLLDSGPQTRSGLTKRLRLDVRGFYRDLELLREAGIAVLLQNQHYVLKQDVNDAANRLPFPDPGLTLGEAIYLAKGRSIVHRKIKGQIGIILTVKR